MSPQMSGLLLVLLALLVAAALLGACWLEYLGRPACSCEPPCTTATRRTPVAIIPAQRSNPRHAAPTTEPKDGNQ